MFRSLATLGDDPGVPGCPFCAFPGEDVLARRGPCFAMWTGEDPAGSAMILPVAHHATPFELSAEEWAATHALLDEVRDIVQGRFDPDGWNVGWNVHPVAGQSIPHAHLHAIPRYHDEAYAGRGIRWWIKSVDNRRA